MVNDYWMPWLFVGLVNVVTNLTLAYLLLVLWYGTIPGGFLSQTVGGHCGTEPTLATTTWFMATEKGLVIGSLLVCFSYLEDFNLYVGGSR